MADTNPALSRRFSAERVRTPLKDTPVVMVNGPRQSGKTTLVREFVASDCAYVSFRKRLAAIAKLALVVIDDFAIAPIGPRERTDLLELLDNRVGTRSTLFTSQLPIEHWHEYIGDPTRVTIPHRDRTFRSRTKIGPVAPESPVTLPWNHRSRSSGILGHVRPETSVTLVRNTHDIRRAGLFHF